MILRLQSNVFNGFLRQVQCLSITLRLQIPCTLIPYTLTHYVRLVLFEVRCLLRRCGDVLRIIYDADKNILKDNRLIHYTKLPVKILGNGAIDTSINVKVDFFSDSAKIKIEKGLDKTIAWFKDFKDFFKHNIYHI